jgi:tetratricopeptide (TPR) repeat protein
LAYRGKVEEGEKISRKAVELQRRLYPRGHEDLGVSLYALGSNLITKNEPKVAEPILLEAVDLIRKHLGENHGYYMASLTMLARASEAAGETELAEARYRQSIDVGRHVPARYRIFTAQAQAFLGLLLSGKGAHAEAASLLQQSEALYREIFGGDENYNVAWVKGQLGFVYFLQGDYVLAEEKSRTALDPLRKFAGPDTPTTLSAQVTLGLSLTRLGRAAEGEVYLREALAIREKLAPKGDFSIAHASSILGECLATQKRFAEAEPLLVNGYNDLKAKLGDQNWRTIAARQRLAKLYDDWNKPEQAAPFR